jgi:hypothetical protein
MKEVQEKRLIEHYEFGGRGSGRNIAALGFESGSIRALYWAGRKREERLRVKRGKRRLEVNRLCEDSNYLDRHSDSSHDSSITSSEDESAHEDVLWPRDSQLRL